MELRWLVTEYPIGNPEEREAYAVRVLQYRTQQTATWLDVPQETATGTLATKGKAE